MSGHVTYSFALVEDEREHAERLSMAFRDATGFLHLHTSPSVSDALRVLPGLKPKLLFIDMNLKDGGGEDLVQELWPRLPKESLMIMLTIVEDSSRMFKALRNGAVGYVLKKDGASAAIAAAREALGGGSPMSSAIARRVVQSFQGHRETAVNRFGLSDREIQILELTARGGKQPDIAEALGISPHTVKNHFRNIYEKMNVHSRGEAMRVYYES